MKHTYNEAAGERKQRKNDNVYEQPMTKITYVRVRTDVMKGQTRCRHTLAPNVSRAVCNKTFRDASGETRYGRVVIGCQWRNKMSSSAPVSYNQALLGTLVFGLLTNVPQLKGCMRPSSGTGIQLYEKTKHVRDQDEKYQSFHVMTTCTNVACVCLVKHWPRTLTFHA